MFSRVALLVALFGAALAAPYSSTLPTPTESLAEATTKALITDAVEIAEDTTFATTEKVEPETKEPEFENTTPKLASHEDKDKISEDAVTTENSATTTETATVSIENVPTTTMDIFDSTEITEISVETTTEYDGHDFEDIETIPKNSRAKRQAEEILASTTQEPTTPAVTADLEMTTKNSKEFTDAPADQGTTTKSAEVTSTLDKATDSF